MTAQPWVVVLGGVLWGAVLATIMVEAALRAAPQRLMRLNVSGRRVPAVLGIPLAGASLTGLAALFALGRAPVEVGAATAVLIAVMFVAGAADDMRGSEAAHGFRGHLRAAASGRITGGFIKIIAGAAAGLAAGFIVATGRAAIEIALCCALAANLVNLLDRAPGRAAKTWLLVSVPLLVWGDPRWGPAAAGMIGAMGAILPADLRERGMLGDAGANPAGAAAGLGLGLSLPEPARVIAVAVLAGLNLASERYSFSDEIARRPWLRALDAFGRRPAGK